MEPILRENKSMHKIQGQILELASKTNIGALTLRELGNRIGEDHPQKIKHHLNQLLKKGFLKEDKSKKLITRMDNENSANLLYSIPVLGYANCGQALAFAEEGFEGYLQVSRSLIPNYEKGKIFAIKAIGDSMNAANIYGEPLDDGDYALVDTSQHDLNFYNNKYVLSIIDGMANIKRLKQDDKNHQIILISESENDYPPIVIGSSDFQNYLINGEVKKVIKNSVN